MRHGGSVPGKLSLSLMYIINSAISNQNLHRLGWILYNWLLILNFTTDFQRFEYLPNESGLEQVFRYECHNKNPVCVKVGSAAGKSSVYIYITHNYVLMWGFVLTRFLSQGSFSYIAICCLSLLINWIKLKWERL